MPEAAAPDVFAPAQLGPLRLRNRIIKAATFEGQTPHGGVTPGLVDFHRTVAAGGVGMSTVAYLAVAPEGRTDRHCIALRPDVVAGLRTVTDAIHDEGAAAAAQIGHAGPVANPRSNRAAALGPSRRFSPMGAVIRGVTTDDVARITADYARGAALLAESGFDSIEVHLGHNYLLSAFLSPKLNRRRDRYGGSIANRAEFPRAVVRAVRGAVGDRLAVTAKLNMDDGVRGGLGVEESIEAAKLLADDGCLDALELTAGSSLANPMYLFRGDAPRKEFAGTLPPPLRIGFRVVGRRFLRAYPFEEGFLMPMARRFLAEVDTPIILLGGINERATMERAMSEGFSFVAMARALLREPDLVRRLRGGETDAGSCIHCNRCMPTIYSGSHCVLVAPEDRPGVRVTATS
jgi:2,4-dienoyl-CoA reductase-like NADH-dependent reductase (Old Yellow Enzyme family)